MMKPGDLVNVYNVPILKREFVGQGVVLEVLGAVPDDDPHVAPIQMLDEDGSPLYTVLVAFNDSPGQAYKVDASEIVERTCLGLVQVEGPENE
ncbi:MAG: hypothetical protein ACYDHF_08055 [Candidatus Cryosericum sp.]